MALENAKKGCNLLIAIGVDISRLPIEIFSPLHTESTISEYVFPFALLGLFDFLKGAQRQCSPP